MKIQDYFPEAFRLLAQSRFCLIEGGVLDQQTGQTYPLEGLEMDEDGWAGVSWLLNWLWLSHSRPGFVLRVPLIVVEGPPMCGKSWLMQRLCEIVGCTGVGFHQAEIPIRLKTLDAMAQTSRALWVIDQPMVLPQRGPRQRAVFEERLVATQRFLSDQLWQTVKGKGVVLTHTLRAVVVVLSTGIDLPEDLKRRSLTIRMGERSVARTEPTTGFPLR